MEKAKGLFSGRRHTKESIKKMSLSHKKNPTRFWLGKKLSLETRKKLSIAHKKYKTFLGKKHSEATKRKISIAKKGKALSMNHKLKVLKAIEVQFKSKQETGIEKKVYEELRSRGLLFEKQKLINGRFIVDAYIPSLNLIIEADGDYWHSKDRIVKKDKAEKAYLTKCGYKLLRLSEQEINNGSFINKLN